MGYFKVTFRQFDTDTFCTNICVADSEESAKEYYNRRYKDVTICPASDYEVIETKRRGLPITECSEWDE